MLDCNENNCYIMYTNYYNVLIFIYLSYDYMNNLQIIR